MNKNPWESYPDIWSSKAAFFSWLRGGLRRALWEKYPPKIVFKNNNVSKPPKDYTGKAKSGAECSLTGEWTGKSKLEVDHVDGHVSLNDWEDLLPFVQHLCVCSDDQMQLVNKEAHKIKSYAERKGISFEEAVIHKQIIQICKDKKDKEWLIKAGVVPAKNAKLRRKQIEEIMLK